MKTNEMSQTAGDNTVQSPGFLAQAIQSVVECNKMQNIMLHKLYFETKPFGILFWIGLLRCALIFKFMLI